MNTNIKNNWGYNDLTRAEFISLDTLKSKTIKWENKSIALFEIAKIKMKSDAKEAINLIEKAISLKGNFSPYIKLYTQILFTNNNNFKALKVLKKYWNHTLTCVIYMHIGVLHAPSVAVFLALALNPCSLSVEHYRLLWSIHS